MRTLYFFSLLAVVTMIGCATPDSGDRAERKTVTSPARKAESRPETVVGKNIAHVIAAAEGKRIQFFTKAGKEVEALPENAPGSVSIHAADGSGQDNYKFNAAGTVTHHLRSYGDDYPAGIWETLP